MANTATIDLRQVARGLDIPLRQIQAVVELLDEGNTVPFITRYRKDRTGGLDEEQIRDIQSRLTKMRLLADRKQTILRSIEAQGKLTEKLAKLIQDATTTKRLEDLYLPFKPKKQTLATAARARGLEELACEILAAAPACADLDARAREFASVERGVSSGADALLGAGHILAEQFSERADLRQRLREILLRTGKIVTTQIGGETTAPAEAVRQPQSAAETAAPPPAPTTAPVAVAETAEPQAAEAPVAGETPAPQPVGETPAPQVASETHSQPSVGDSPAPTNDSTAEPLVQVVNVSDGVASHLAEAQDAKPQAADGASAGETPAPQAPPAVQVAAKRGKDKEKAKAARLSKKELKEQKKKKLDERRIKAFRDYFNYSEEIKKIPPHRILAINRAERAKVLRVKIESDLEAMHAAVEELLVPPGHPHADYLRGCAHDALARLILPALEREARRELTDRAESHAVGVFAKNLRNLLLQPPIHNRRVLAVDPGYKNGCKMAALDQFGNVLGHDIVFLVGKPERREEAKQKSLALIQQLQLNVIAIGNGTACRDAEDFFAAMLDNELKGQGVAYAIVNEAGASVYSTSQLGREEFPEYDATLRGAISIGRRLLDPLSELVKIEPASIGVGQYQHDVKAKHLQTSLDEVVESCVNCVGVDVNTASPALLRYVSGLNQLTARRVFEHRREHGPFRSREQLRAVPGFGDATFVQAAGFLKITAGDNPFDATWIHPESYPVATQVLEQVGGRPADLADKEAGAAVATKVAAVDINAVASQLGVGTLTLKDILAQLARPGRDPREDLPQPMFKQGVIKIEDLTPGMELSGTVLNVVDFGCFVDIGMHDSGLVHVSHMADRFIRDPHEVVAVGDIIHVWVLGVDKERRRVSLTLVRPGSERQRPPRRGEGAAAEGGQQQQQRPPRPSGRDEGRGARGEGRGARSEGRGGPKPGGEGRPQRGDGRGQPPQGGRPPRQGPPRGGPRSHDRPPPRQQYQPKPKPKPLIPITNSMKEGKEPMRTFGDLLQFYEVKQKSEEPPRHKPPAAPPAATPPPEGLAAAPTPAQTEPAEPPRDAASSPEPQAAVPPSAPEPPPAVEAPQQPES